MPLDVDRARRETSGCREVAHLNNAGAALPPDAVTEAVIDHLRLEARIGGYEAAAQAAEATAHTYSAVAELLGCADTEVALVENATRAWDMAFYSLSFSPGDRILTSTAEYASNALALLQVAQRTGARIEVLADDEHGQVDLTDLAERLDSTVKLVAVTHVPTHGGLVNPAEGIGTLTRAAGVPFLLDACQSAGQLPLDVRTLGCDMLSATGRKFLRGPRGTGFLYVAESLADRLQPPFLDLHSASWTGPDTFTVAPGARRFETWEGNVAGKIGLGVAVDHALQWGLPAIAERITTVAATLRERLRELPHVQVHDRGERLCGIVTFSVHDAASADVSAQLRRAGINTSVTTAANSRFDPHAQQDLVRASVHYYNTTDEIDQLCAALPR
ncbi:aminotransferase class V-fold PLP-dependent enzyme [Rhodococcus sp. X156]|uniref:aminotransferase class V-fold PLP-dependent enzyme n=1 Tax=Rhodococcus sp. X156 TaxID=2499145 RepID=UPI000FD7B500|nr:aminotransferase class V-fold PLP-dependent enzyme [Rhodococcus sp. X156]